MELKLCGSKLEIAYELKLRNRDARRQKNYFEKADFSKEVQARILDKRRMHWET